MVLVLLLTLPNVRIVAMISFILVLIVTLINPVILVFFRVLLHVRFMSKVFPPAIPSDSLPVSADGQRWFLVHDSIADPFAERIVEHYRRPSKYDLGGQLSLWELESKKTV